MKLLESIRASLTPRVLLGLAVLTVLVVAAALDRLLQANALLEARVLLLKEEQSALSQFEEPADLHAEILRLESELASEERLLLREDTEGLNSAKLQSMLSDVLEQCGLQNVSMRVDALPDESATGLVRLDAIVRARDPDDVFAQCLVDIAELEIRIITDSARWTRNGSLLVTFVSFAEDGVSG